MFIWQVAQGDEAYERLQDSTTDLKILHHKLKRERLHVMQLQQDKVCPEAAAPPRVIASHLASLCSICVAYQDP